MTKPQSQQKNTPNQFQTGFALLYAILLTGAVLSVGVILMNIITKQLIFSSIARSSETSYYYLSSSGRECLFHYATDYGGDSAFFDPILPNKPVPFIEEVTIRCFGQDITFTKTGESNKPIYESDVSLGGDNLNLWVQFNGDCLDYGPKSSTPCEKSDDKLIDGRKAVIFSRGSSGTNRSTLRVSSQLWE